MKHSLLLFFLILQPLFYCVEASTTRTMDSTIDSTIEGIYQVQPTSYRIYYGNNVAYGRSYEIQILNNGDGTYYVDDLFGGWYCKGRGYGSNYCMIGNIAIDDDGSVSLQNSFVTGWGDSLSGLTGTYDSATSTFMIEAEYVSGMIFYQTWVKIGEVQVFNTDGINYSIGENNTASVTKGNYTGDIVIPSQVSNNGIDYSVTSIGDGAFAGCIGLTSVIIPITVTSIDRAFTDCTNLTSIDIPNSVISIAGAFSGCTGLTSVTIPNSVTSIDGAFSGCTNLTSIDIPNSITSLVGAFSGCTSLTSVSIPNSVVEIGASAFYGCSGIRSITIPSSVVTIGDEAFGECTSLTSITIPDNVETIGVYAFSGCSNLTSVTIRNGVKAIGDGAFTDCCSLEKLFIPQSVIQIGGWITTRCPIISLQVEDRNPVYDSRNNCNAIIETASNTLIRGCKNTIIPNNITTIGESSFSYCSGLTTIAIPNSVTSIESNAFRECIDLTTLSLPSSVESLGELAFPACGLTSIDFSEGLKKIGNNCFSGCGNLNSIILPQSVKTIGEGVFNGCYSVESIKVKEGNPIYYSRDNCNCIIETASNTLVIGCKNTIIPNGIVTIGNYAFSGCKELSFITIPNSVNRIGNSAFYSCSALSSIDIPNSVNSIGNDVFAHCSSLTSMIIPSSVSDIGYSVFWKCSNLTTVTIHNCYYLGSMFFQDCPQLKDIYFYMSYPPQVSDNTFDDTNIGNITLHVPAGYIDSYKNRDPWNRFKEIVEIDMSAIRIPVLDNSRKTYYYNLQGQREDNPSKGIYIMNGKKVIVK